MVKGWPRMKVVGRSSELTELEESPLRYASAPEGRAHAGTVSRCFSRGLSGFLSLVTSALPNFALLFLKAYFLFSTLIFFVCMCTCTGTLCTLVEVRGQPMLLLEVSKLMRSCSPLLLLWSQPYLPFSLCHPPVLLRSSEAELMPLLGAECLLGA